MNLVLAGLHPGVIMFRKVKIKHTNMDNQNEHDMKNQQTSRNL